MVLVGYQCALTATIFLAGCPITNSEPAYKFIQLQRRKGPTLIFQFDRLRPKVLLGIQLELISTSPS